MKPIHAVDNFFKRRVISQISRPDESTQVERVRKDMKRGEDDVVRDIPRPIVAEICFEG